MRRSKLEAALRSVTEHKKFKKKIDWSGVFNLLPNALICEIGVRQGHNLANFVSYRPKMLVGVDTWLEKSDDAGFNQKALTDMHLNLQRMYLGNPIVTLIREDSVVAAACIPDHLFDLIWIDGDHSYSGCAADIQAWSKKVKYGGILAGDDYCEKFSGVKQAVSDFSTLINQNPIFLPRNGWAFIV